MSIGAKYFWVVTVGLVLLTSIGPAAAKDLTSAQIVKPAELTEQESAYYQKLTDPAVAKNFLETRSYVRVCRQVVDHKMPAIELPDKPLGFSVRYLLPGEANVINSAISDSIVAGIEADRKKH